MDTSPPNRFRKALAAGVIALTGFGAVATLAPAIAEAHDAPTTEEREARQAARQERRAAKIATITDVLGVTEQELLDARESGMSLAEVAEANGVAVETLVDALIAQMEAHINEHIAAGDIDADRAAEVLERVEERITERVNSEPGEFDGRRGHRGRFGGNAGTDEPAGA